MSIENERTAVENDIVSYLPALQSFARRFHTSQTDVDDLVQDTIAKALANLDKYQPGTQLKSWLFTIMRNTFCTKFGLSKREQVGVVDDSASRSSVPPSQEWVVRGHELERAVLRLPQPYRTAFNLIFVEGVSYDAAAERFGCPIGTIKSRVSRAREILTRELN